MLFYILLCYVILCYDMLCHVVLCYVMLCYVMICYVMSQKWLIASTFDLNNTCDACNLLSISGNKH